MDSLLGWGQCQLRTRLSSHPAQSLGHSLLWGGIVRECAHTSGPRFLWEWELLLSTFRTIPYRPERLDHRLLHPRFQFFRKWWFTAHRFDSREPG